MTVVIERMSVAQLRDEYESIEREVGDIAAFEQRARENDLNAHERYIFDLLCSNRHLMGHGG